MKLFYCDLETTGLDPAKNGVQQIAGMIELDGVEKERFNFDVKPFRGKIISKQALVVTGKTVEDLETYEEPMTVYATLFKLISQYVDRYNRNDKFFFVAYNARFDMDFLRQWFADCGDKYFGSYFWFPYLCVMDLAGWKLADKRPTMQNFKLTTVARQLGLQFDESEAHDGLFDVDLTKKVYQALYNIPITVKSETAA